MIPVNQTIVDRDKGNCTEACFASLFNLNINEVPEFRKDHQIEDENKFLVSKGFKIAGFKFKYQGELDLSYSVDGKHFFASVRSKTYPDKSHAVIINRDRIVIHDPNPNKKWLGLSIIDDDLSQVTLIETIVGNVK